ncbi:MAG: 23S rRNA (adenine(2503)-C(2))-methyltransferase RlmN [Desulforegulaceae bacterium]|nr:23S rRNA (adenine(2503)-C(2))-methyltransferase RlmN [Desulforegulaceae bacterium]
MSKILSFTLDDLTSYLNKNFGKGKFHSKCIYRYFYKTGKSDLENLDCFTTKDLPLKIKEDLKFPNPVVLEKKESEDVIKIALELDDKSVVETVIIKMKTRDTLCVSSQVGCKMNCQFCATAKMGFKRNLLTHEILLQFYTAKFVLGYDIRNIVFMGMGEPLDNYENVRKAILILNEQQGFDISFRHITISTSGLCNQIEKLGKDVDIKPNLSVSINSADNDLRKSIMPVTNKFNLLTLRKTLLNYPLKPKGIIFITYTLFKGLNDGKKDALKLVNFLEGIPCRVNLIPYNKVEGCDFKGCNDKDLGDFSDLLESYGLFVRKRWAKGENLDAGCGQLAGKLKGGRAG